MQEYAEMKNSGIPWIGCVPSHWGVHTLYQFASQVKKKNSDLSERNLLSLSYGRIKRKNIDAPEGLLPASFDGYNIIEEGDIVLRLTDLQNDHTSLRVGRAEERGIITSAYITIRPEKPTMSKFLYYLLYTFDIRKGFYGMGSGVRQGLNYDEVKALRIVMPSSEEQVTIAAYLDEQCGIIDAAIAGAKASVEEYRSLKTSIIYEAVTKGLDRNVEMRDSGIDIIGLMPRCWCLRKLRFLCSVMTGNMDTQDAVDNGQYPFYVRSPIVERSNDYTYDGEGILMAGDGVGAGKVFHHAIGKYAIHQRVYCFIDFKDIVPSFMYYYMENLFSAEIEKGSAKSTVPSVRMPMLLNFKICLPPMNTQHQIVDMLNKRVKEINEIIERKLAIVQDLETYRKSLIYEVVTGKRKVV